MVNIIPYQKAQHVAPKIEDIKEGEIMAITLNPSKEHDPTKHVMVFIKSQYNYLSEHSETGGYKLLLFPESSPLGRIHFHGYIVIDNLLNWLTKGVILLKDLNSFAIKKFFDTDKPQDEDEEHLSGTEKWMKYCIKQKHIFKPLFDNNTLDYPIDIRFNNDGGAGDSPAGASPLPSSTIEPRPVFKIKEPTLRRTPTIRVRASAT